MLAKAFRTRTYGTFTFTEPRRRTVLPKFLQCLGRLLLGIPSAITQDAPIRALTKQLVHRLVRSGRLQIFYGSDTEDSHANQVGGPWCAQRERSALYSSVSGEQLPRVRRFTWMHTANRSLRYSLRIGRRRLISHAARFSVRREKIL